MGKLLIVGGGSIGQVLGLALSTAGNEVHFLARHGKPAYSVRRLTRFGQRPALNFRPASQSAAVDALPAIAFDAIWLCVQSTALTADFLAALAARAPLASIVTLGLDLNDRATLERHWPASQIVPVALPQLAFDTNGTTDYWIPPGAKIAVYDAGQHGSSIIDLLVKAGLPAEIKASDGSNLMRAATAVPIVASLRQSGWSLRALRANPQGAIAAAHEATKPRP